ncbi:MAG: hypothetical protein Sapg2KO_03770 [Saprospiraceae bacterium]
MINLLLTLSLFFTSSTPSEDVVCSCITITTTVCGNIRPIGDQLLGLVLSYDANGLYGGELYQMKVIDASDSSINGDTVLIGGSDGANCVLSSLFTFPGDTLFMNLGYVGDPNVDYYIAGCGVNRLRFRNDSLRGPIMPGVNSMAYADFKAEYPSCYESPKHFKMFGEIETWNRGTKLQDINLIINNIPVGSGWDLQSEGRFRYDYVPVKDFSYVSDSILIQATEGVVEQGLTALDLIKIKRHILNTGPRLRSEERIAADVNFSGTITAQDIIEIQKVILGRSDRFSSNETWVIYPEDFPFRNSETYITGQFNKFTTPVSIFNFLKFKAIKLGDVTGDI